MLNGITFWTEDKIWRGILNDLGAEFAPREIADFIVPNNMIKLSVFELKSFILKSIDENENKIIAQIVGSHNCAPLPRSGNNIIALTRDRAQVCAPTDSQKKIIIALHRAGAAGLSADELQKKLGYAPDAATNAINTAIYQLRKTFGKEFIKNENGKYKL